MCPAMPVAEAISPGNRLAAPQINDIDNASPRTTTKELSIT
jgi:hypothetical protein